MFVSFCTCYLLELWREAICWSYVGIVQVVFFLYSQCKIVSITVETLFILVIINIYEVLICI